MYALVDANNFYVSCERVFRPALRGRPVVVLSNNDGCAIARSDEAKALGIAMAEPWHMIRQRLPDAGVVALSANFALYGDMSNRFMALAAGLGPEQEIYSIDESFVGLQGVRGDLGARAQALRQRIRDWIGIPSCVGIGPTKTLAKFANHVAKEAWRKPGSYPAELAHVCHLGALPAPQVQALLAATPLRDIWGIGPRLSEQLTADGVRHAAELAALDPAAVRRRWSVVVERTVRELQGCSCIDVDAVPAPRKEVSCTRAFGDAVDTIEPLLEAVSDYATRAAVKLREDGSVAARVLVFIHTNPFRRWERQYAKSVVVPLRRPTCATSAIVDAALRGLRAIHVPGFRIHKAGVILTDLCDAAHEQHELALDDDSRDKPALMAALDRLNDRYGRDAVQVASSGLGGRKRSWVMKQQWLTPQYTTNWDHLPVAHA
jgi:DNA polymerase V